MASSTKVIVNGESYTVLIKELSRTKAVLEINNRTYDIGFEAPTPLVVSSSSKNLPRKEGAKRDSQKATPAPQNADGATTAPIPGVVVKVLVATGDQVSVGEVLLRLEAMKMENNIFADKDGTVKEIYVDEGDEVSNGQALLLVE